MNSSNHDKKFICWPINECEICQKKSDEITELQFKAFINDNIEENIRKCKINGEFKEYYKDGQLKEQCFYKNGKKEDEYKEYYENGVLKKQCFYKNQLRQGECKEYYDTGQLHELCYYKNEIREGRQELYDINGEITKLKFYKNGKTIN